MHVEQISFDRVFDTQALTGSFSFERGGWPVYGVSVPGMAIPAAGATYAVAFAEPGNWEKVLGWRDLSTSKVHLTHSAWAVGIRQIPYLYLLLSVPFGLGTAFGGNWVAGLIAALLLLPFFAAVCRAAWRNRWVAQALQAGSPAVGPIGRPGWKAQLMWTLAPFLFWN